MKKIRLHEIADARSGDKGQNTNVGLIARSDAVYELICEQVTAEKVKLHFGDMVKGKVVRHQLPNLRALNFMLHDSLGGGGSRSLRIDAQGKTHGQALLLMEVEIPNELNIGL